MWITACVLGGRHNLKAMEWWPNVGRETAPTRRWDRISLRSLRRVSPSLWDSQLRFNSCVFVDDAISESSSLPPTLKQRIDTRGSTKLRCKSRLLCFWKLEAEGKYMHRTDPTRGFGQQKLEWAHQDRSRNLWNGVSNFQVSSAPLTAVLFQKPFQCAF